MSDFVLSRNHSRCRNMCC